MSCTAEDFLPKVTVEITELKRFQRGHPLSFEIDDVKLALGIAQDKPVGAVGECTAPVFTTSCTEGGIESAQEAPPDIEYVDFGFLDD